MSGSQVTVLCPNGRRVIVKTTPGLSILQVIENACQKQKLNPDLYDIKLIRRTLDPSSTIRFSNIPNNAQLELFEASTPRLAGLVNISLATETGQRLVAKFPSSATIMDVLKYHEEKGCLQVPPPASDRVPVVVYTMETLAGERLAATTLKSLGIVQGSYMLRYLVQSAASEGSLQLHGSGSLAKPKEDRIVPHAEEPSSNLHMDCAVPESSTDDPPPPPARVMAAEEIPRLFSASQGQEDPVSNLDIVKSTNRGEVPDVLCSDKIRSPPDVLKLTSDVTTPSGESSPSLDLVMSHVVSNLPDVSARVDHQAMEVEGAVALEQDQETDRIIPLGDHNSVLFCLDDAPPTVEQEEDDSFFQLSVNEVRKLHVEQIKLLKELEEAPLMTERIRSMEEEGKLLSAMKSHPDTHIRVVFPDRMVIQGVFKPHDTVGTVKEFLCRFLRNPRAEFYLYTIFPKKILEAHLSLVEANCIPNARLYFGSDVLGEKFLTEEAMLKKSSYSGAQRALKKSRGTALYAPPPEDSITRTLPKSPRQPPPETREPTQRVPSSNKVPKWFKLSK